MLHPKQFDVNEAWILFRLNQEAIRTEQDGNFNCIALMDAASCFILGIEFVAATATEPTQVEFRRLLKSAQRHRHRLPKTLFIPAEDAATVTTRVATSQKIGVVRLPEAELLVFIGEARREFAERFAEPPRH
jgi:hypothetical protein